MEGVEEVAVELADTFIRPPQAIQTDMSLSFGTGMIWATPAKGQSSVASCNCRALDPACPSPHFSPASGMSSGMCVQAIMHVYGYAFATLSGYICGFG